MSDGDQSLALLTSLSFPPYGPDLQTGGDEFSLIVTPLPPCDHMIEIQGGNTGLANPRGSTENIWWNWVVGHITVTP